MKKTLALLLTGILALSLALAGCSSSTSKEKDDGKGGSSEAKGGVLIYGKGGDAVGLDPAIVTDGESFIVTQQIFETLVKYGEDDTEIKSGLAKSWEVSDDAKTYTFKLETGIKFHDGTDFNADAVVKNFQRWAQSKDEGKFAYYASMFGGFEGDEGHVIKEVKAIDASTVEFTLNRPQAPFLKNLAMPTFAIASPDGIEKEGDDFTKNPSGTGPFKFKSWKPGDTIEVVKNDDYWQDGLPKLDGVTFKVIKDNSARLNAAIKGEIDLMDGLNPSDISKVTGDEKLQIFERASMNVGYFAFNVEKAPFDKKEVRQAISHLINKKEIIDNFYEGTAEPAKNPIPPSVSGYNDKIEDYDYDVEKAKELLKKAGLEDGFKMDLWAMPVPRPYMPDGQKVAEAIQASLKQVGIEANIVSYEWAAYLEKVQAGEAQSFMMGWTGDNGDADNFLYTLLDKDNIGSNNYARYANDEVHELLIEAQSTADEAKRNELYGKAQEIIHDEAPWVPLVHSLPQLAGSKTVKGFVPHPTGSQSLVNVSLEN
ncbi:MULTISPECIES: ABC transporter substrate-binding protein [Bacillaceae]|jgi:peptide/nickel transport system substrate-binding protein|uniref:ABC transporter substrate-binding protein n=1 Tax=Bacillaceae TaxID=186817 RepID=UPI00065F81B9|nr:MULTISPECIES: ABC transporter substrate-binding protein [Bacillaceae]MCF7625197.1 ABC transporter substrate-binding protein [Peribacillus frigoritolerans]MCP1092772.1 ABC transporter substrate-binding protein [Bacillaceae bacterium OS4b]PRA92558.1 ABC transporter substrate-binding protein [Peribacillus simplex]